MQCQNLFEKHFKSQKDLPDIVKNSDADFSKSLKDKKSNSVLNNERGSMSALPAKISYKISAKILSPEEEN